MRLKKLQNGRWEVAFHGVTFEGPWDLVSQFMFDRGVTSEDAAKAFKESRVNDVARFELASITRAADFGYAVLDLAALRDAKCDLADATLAKRSAREKAALAEIVQDIALEMDVSRILRVIGADDEDLEGWDAA
jgi:hypothetical protein